MARRESVTRGSAESLAIQALSFIASDPERLAGFIAATGLAVDQIRIAASDRSFLAGVLDHAVSDETLLRAFADQAQVEPAVVIRAQAMLSGPAWEHDAP